MEWVICFDEYGGSERSSTRFYNYIYNVVQMVEI